MSPVGKCSASDGVLLGGSEREGHRQAEDNGVLNTNLIFRICSAWLLALYLFWRELLKHFKRAIDLHTTGARYTHGVIIFRLVNELRYCRLEE